MPENLSDFNIAAWAGGDHVRYYDRTDVKPAEAALLERYRAELAGRVLELGCGAGRVTRALAGLGGAVSALDVSPLMVVACQRNVPEVRAEVGDLRDLSRFDDGAFTALIAADNVLDVLDDSDRRAALSGWARVLDPGGVLVFSSHNRGGIRRHPGLARRLRDLRHPLRSARNRRAARAFEYADDDYAIVNDAAHEHRLAHYYIRQDAQESQLAAAGFDLLECLDADGRPVGPGDSAEHSSELHYAARKQT